MRAGEDLEDARPVNLSGRRAAATRVNAEGARTGPQLPSTTTTPVMNGPPASGGAQFSEMKSWKAPGVIPVTRLNVRLKWLWSLKPVSRAIDAREAAGSARR